VNRHFAIAALVAAALAASGAWAETIYRWVDQDGVVHFDGNPPHGVDATKVGALPESGGLSAPAPATVPAAEGQETPVSYAEKKRRDRAEKREAAQKSDAEIRIQCAAMKRQRDALEPSTRVIVTDANGNPVRMDDGERLAKLQQAQDYLSKNCK